MRNSDAIVYEPELPRVDVGRVLQFTLLDIESADRQQLVDQRDGCQQCQQCTAPTPKFTNPL
jgi:hypothetical protein